MHVFSVLIQVHCVIEAQAAHFALVGLLLVVPCPLVSPQSAFTVEALLAQLADEGPLTSVRPLVLNDIPAMIS